MNNQNKLSKVKASILSVCLLLVLFSFIDPFDAASGSRDNNSYSEIFSNLENSPYAKALFIASDDDYFSFERTNQMRKKFSEDVAYEGTNEVFSAASFGDWSFNKYLIQENITHVVVPIESSKKGKITRKWGNHGSVQLSLRKPFFVKKAVSTGEYPVAIYEVVNTHGYKIRFNLYEFVWDRSMRESFYKKIMTQSEVGLYSYNYESRFQDGPTVSWVMADASGKAEIPSFMVKTLDQSAKSKFQITIEFVAAYGSFAPVQVVTISSANWTKSVTISSNHPGRISFNVESGESIKFGNSLPCRAASNFDLTTTDTRRFCYGVSHINVRPSQVD